VNSLFLIDIIAGFISGFITGIFSIATVSYSRNYSASRNRRKIIKVIFKKIIPPFENKQNINLNDVVSFTNFLRIGYKFFFFLVVFIIFLALSEGDKSSVHFYNSLFLIFIASAFAFDFLIMLLPLTLLFNKKQRINERKLLKYIMRKATYWTDIDFIIGWLIFTYFFWLIYLMDFKIFRSGLEQFLLVYLIVSVILLFPASIPIFSKLIGEEIERYSDLDSSIFGDFKLDAGIKITIHTAGGSIKGKIDRIVDELVLNPEFSGDTTVHIPWENVIFFEIESEKKNK